MGLVREEIHKMRLIQCSMLEKLSAHTDTSVDRTPDKGIRGVYIPCLFMGSWDAEVLDGQCVDGKCLSLSEGRI